VKLVVKRLLIIYGLEITICELQSGQIFKVPIWHLRSSLLQPLEE